MTNGHEGREYDERTGRISRNKIVHQYVNQNTGHDKKKYNSI